MKLFLLLKQIGVQPDINRRIEAGIQPCHAPFTATWHMTGATAVAAVKHFPRPTLSDITPRDRRFPKVEAVIKNPISITKCSSFCIYYAGEATLRREDVYRQKEKYLAVLMP
ncbi:hypothetical protein CEXT_141631 [Caerostris extrusa]|uniref:Uncharacterized protein n=1 Tax=Caerostris extrusa TaxID=172846 RepID=A0AAV4URE8_CAEEX|nr:hypothetical protein CEXT_141631 [Caerostris extrusa]